ncbi:MAG: 16S rRNA (cytidine(1402)-2'-O)-methyltransferase [Candidatus Taylorbacteria bacterium]|nr:16S rRNA (cytidine(1402)-2'-O)-methyltransferase [Candidatus Taylorbacteria bacterium]
MSSLYIVGTPIGNLEDVSLRALKVLSSVDTILCEDTRVTKKLLMRHGIGTPTLSYHSHSKISRVETIIAMLREGKNLALVSDAGTPGISDPGAELVAHVRQELAGEISAGEIKIESIPGPSALTAALSIAGVTCANFVFLGFLPHKKGRETLFKEIAASDRTVVFYESPHRIMKTLQSLTKHLGDMPKRVSVCREMTKIFEEVVSGSASSVLNNFEKHPDAVRGEFVVIVSKA